MKGTFDPRWYRRAFHTFAACFIAYYLIPENTGDLLWVFVAKRAVVATVICVLTFIEIIRLRGIIKTEVFFGLRLYEQKRVCSYLYFGIGSSVLLLFFPQAIAVPCILAAAITDPVMGELRRVSQKWVSMLFGAVLSFGFFMVCNYDPVPAAFGASLVVAGEMLSNKLIDDDLLMQILPAAGLAIIAMVFPGTGMIPSPFITPLVYPW
ncbi:MAG: hypothetical protein PHH26_07635 [Candidatus Thermoplasmatota archaeon]|nr:hypothetical protein [Candidatus Thermoplasmatota archaeon]